MWVGPLVSFRDGYIQVEEHLSDISLSWLLETDRWITDWRMCNSVCWRNHIRLQAATVTGSAVTSGIKMMLSLQQ